MHIASMVEICLLMVTSVLCSSPHPDSSARTNQEPAQEVPGRKISLLARPFGLGWRDRNKVCFSYAAYMVCFSYAAYSICYSAVVHWCM